MTVPTSVFSDELFDDVSLEWDTVCREVDHHKQAAAQEVSSVWSTALPAVESEFQQLIAQGDWQRGPEDIFSIIGLERNEVRHSAMMAWLLDHLGRHGFGTALLEAILEECFPATKLRVRGTTTIVCEVARGDTRADIIVWSQDFTLIIENKVDAVEGYRQCDRIYRHFRDEPGALFLFVTPKGRRPRTATGDAADVSATLSLRRIHRMLDTIAAKNPDARNVAGATVLTYLRTMEKELS